MFQHNHQACQNYRYALTLPKVLLLMGQLNARHILTDPVTTAVRDATDFTMAL